jgi:drug/metabolite transporter (DMT)-like permease
MLSSHTKGIYLGALAALISGVSIFVNKFAVDIIQPPLVFTATKNISVGLLIICIILATKKWQLIKKISRKDLINLILIGVIGGSVPFYLFFTGLSLVPAINAAIIQKTLVLWVIILAIPILKEKLSKLQILAVVLLFTGNFLIGGFKGFQLSQGELFILFAAIFWAIETILAKKILPRVDPDIVMVFRMGFGSVILLSTAVVAVPNALNKSLFLTPMQWFFMITTVALLLSYIMTWYRALKYAPAIMVTSILISSTLVTNILSAIFITHVWTEIMGIQAALILLGLGFLSLSIRKETVVSFLSKKISSAPRFYSKF